MSIAFAIAPGNKQNVPPPSRSVRESETQQNTDALSAPTGNIYKQKSAALPPVKGRLGYEDKDENPNRSRPPRPQDSKTRCTEKKSEMLTSACV